MSGFNGSGSGENKILLLGGAIGFLVGLPKGGLSGGLIGALVGGIGLIVVFLLMIFTYWGIINIIIRIKKYIIFLLSFAFL